MTDVYQKKDEVWSIDRLIPYALNSKKHDPKQVAKIAASIAKHGWTTRIIVEPDGTVIAGHGRRLAAIDLMHEKVPVTVLHGISKEQARALRLIDNKTNEGGHDTALLSQELKELVLDEGIDMGDFFDVRDLSFAIDDLGDMDLDSLSPDIAPEVTAQTARTEAEIETKDEEGVSLTKAIGVSQISGAQARELKRFIGEAQDFYGCEPAEALLRAMNDWHDGQARDLDDLK